jgi:hypothetical protein
MTDTETLTPGAVRAGAPVVRALPTAPSALAVATGAPRAAAPVHQPVQTGALTPSAPAAPVQTKPVQPVRAVQNQPVQPVRKEVTTVQGSADTTKNPVQDGAERVQYSPVRTVMSIVVLAFALAISVGAAYESFFAFERLATFFGWPAQHAWIIMPLTEAFLVLGSFELAIRIMEGGKLWAPRLMAYGALVITLAVNVGYHVLTLLLPIDENDRLVKGVTTLNTVHWWQPAALAVFAAIVPTAQLLALHVFSGRLRRLAEARRVVRTEDTGPGVFSLLHRAAVNRIATIVPAPVQPVQQQNPAPVQQPVQNTAHQTGAPANPTPTPRPAAGAPVQPHRTAPVHTERTTNVVEINEASKRSMEEALRRIHSHFAKEHHGSWEQLAASVSLTKIEQQLNIGKRRSKPALEHAERVLPWAELTATPAANQG